MRLHRLATRRGSTFHCFAQVPTASKGLTITLAGLRHTFVVRPGILLSAQRTRPALTASVVSQVADPALPDCPIVFASQGRVPCAFGALLRRCEQQALTPLAQVL